MYRIYRESLRLSRLSPHLHSAFCAFFLVDLGADSAGLGQKLEDALAVARKLTSQRQSQLFKVKYTRSKRHAPLKNPRTLRGLITVHDMQLQKCYLQVQDYTEKLKSCELELQVGCLSSFVNRLLSGGLALGPRSNIIIGLMQHILLMMNGRRLAKGDRGSI